MGVMLEVQNLNKTFDDIKAVDDLSFTVNEGDVYGFLGQNGAGKSTTIRMLLTLIKPDSGSIRIFQKNLTEHRSEILKNTGAVVERPDLYKYLSAYDNLFLFAKISGVKTTRKLIMDQLQMVGLAERSGSKVKTFSQGMKQRLGIAVALVHDPKLIILDEPTNGLDPQGIADMRNLIRVLSREMGKTVIVSSHLLNEIEQIASRMIIINRGKKIAEGVVSELLDPSRTVVQVETSGNEKALEILKTKMPGSEVTIAEPFLRLNMNKTGVPELINILAAAGISIYSIQTRNSLEDYFLSLTNAQNYVEPVAN